METSQSVLTVVWLPARAPHRQHRAVHVLQEAYHVITDDPKNDSSEHAYLACCASKNNIDFLTNNPLETFIKA